MKVHVDPTRCRGHALCITQMPEIFQFVDEEDRSEAVGGEVDAGVVERLRLVEQNCPEMAIVLDE